MSALASYCTECGQSFANGKPYPSRCPSCRCRFRIDLRDTREGSDDFDVMVYVERDQMHNLVVTSGNSMAATICVDPDDLAQVLWTEIQQAINRAEKRNGL